MLLHAYSQLLIKCIILLLFINVLHRVIMYKIVQVSNRYAVFRK